MKTEFLSSQPIMFQPQPFDKFSPDWAMCVRDEKISRTGTKAEKDAEKALEMKINHK